RASADPGPGPRSARRRLVALTPAEPQPALHAGPPVLVAVQQEEEPPPEVPLRDTARPQAAVGERVRDRDAGHAADAEAGGHRPLDRLGVLQREADAQLGQEAAHRAIERLARPRALLAHDPDRPAQIAVAERALAREGVLGRAEHHQLIVAPGGEL